MILNEGFRNLAVGVEAGIGKLQQIDITLEDAARDIKVIALFSKKNIQTS